MLNTEYFQNLKYSRGVRIGFGFHRDEDGTEWRDRLFGTGHPIQQRHQIQLFFTSDRQFFKKIVEAPPWPCTKIDYIRG